MTKENSLALEYHDMPKVRQIGIVVADIEEAMKQYSRLMNASTWYRVKVAETEVYYRSRKIELELDLVLAYSGKTQLELIKVISGERNIYSDFLKEYAKGGIHHLGFLVNDFDKRLARMQTMGMEVLQHGIITSQGKAITKFAYFDTVPDTGYIIEIIETKLKGIPVSQSRMMMELGVLTGDVNKIKLT